MVSKEIEEKGDLNRLDENDHYLTLTKDE